MSGRYIDEHLRANAGKTLTTKEKRMYEFYVGVRLFVMNFMLVFAFCVVGLFVFLVVVRVTACTRARVCSRVSRLLRVSLQAGRHRRGSMVGG